MRVDSHDREVSGEGVDASGQSKVIVQCRERAPCCEQLVQSLHSHTSLSHVAAEAHDRAVGGAGVSIPWQSRLIEQRRVCVPSASHAFQLVQIQTSAVHAADACVDRASSGGWNELARSDEGASAFAENAASAQIARIDESERVFIPPRTLAVTMSDEAEPP
ncbi:MAG: hypothetical protein WC538_10275 [Thermoanaerobaculia bacterium]|jgi:hypothetical protein